MIILEQVTFAYPEATTPTLRDISLTIPPGELALVIGRTASGKSTLLRTLNGLVPRFTGGTLSGRVTVAGMETSGRPVREMAELVGYVAQDPALGFVTETVEEELAYTMEQLGVTAPVMRKRVEETLDLLGLGNLRHRRLKELSGGEAQRVAIGAVLTAHPPVMVMDEPTSGLDPAAAEEVLATVTRLVHDLGTTVMMAEHRLERVIQYADLAIHLDENGSVVTGAPREVMEASTVAPAVVDLGRLAGWRPVPLSVRDARRLAGELTARLPASPSKRDAAGKGPLVLAADDVTVVHGGTIAVGSVDLEVAAGEVVALMGRNGAGKSSLLWAIQGSGRRDTGMVRVTGVDPGRLSPSEARRLVGLVPHGPADLLFMETVTDECRRSDRSLGIDEGSTLALAGRLLGSIDPDQHPADLSEGQKLGLVLAIQLAARPSLLLLDEPTRGLDYDAKQRLAQVLGETVRNGACVLVATHDVEFVAGTANRVLVMADGEIVADGPTREVVVSSPIFAPQVAKVLAPGPWLTVAEVAEELRPV